MPHLHEQLDFTAEVFIVFQDRVLLRKHDKYGIWLSIGGHIELGEDPNEAALREVREEVGLDVTLADDLRFPNERSDTYRELIPPKAMNRHDVSPTHEHVTMVYFARAATDRLVVPEEEKTDGLRWFSRAELESNGEVEPRISSLALRALEELGA